MSDVSTTAVAPEQTATTESTGKRGKKPLLDFPVPAEKLNWDHTITDSDGNVIGGFTNTDLACEYGVHKMLTADDFVGGDEMCDWWKLQQYYPSKEKSFVRKFEKAVEPVRHEMSKLHVQLVEGKALAAEYEIEDEKAQNALAELLVAMENASDEDKAKFKAILASR